MTDNEKKDLIVTESQPIELQPKEMLEFATSSAKLLKEIVTSAKTSVKINGTEYLKFEAWQTIARFYHATVTIEWTKPFYTEDGVTIQGFDARANVIDKTGRVIGSAESSCSKEEKTWSTRATFQIKSMAQTRACAKALRNVYSWVVVLSGYAPTPAEEMDPTGETDSGVPTGASHQYGNRTDGPLNITPQPIKNAKIVEQVIKEDQEKHTRPATPKCMATGCNKLLTTKIYDYSMNNFGVPFCYDHQQEMKKRQSGGGDFTDGTDIKDEPIEE